MSLQELGSLGEFLGFIAVLATLVYLSVQTRQAKRSAQVESCRQLMSDFQSLWTILSESEEYALLVRRAANDWNSISKTDQMRVHSFFASLMAHYIGAISQEDLPGLREFIGVWENNILGLLQCPGGQQWWDGCRYLAPSSLTARLDARLANPATLPGAWTESIPWWGLDEDEVP